MSTDLDSHLQNRWLRTGLALVAGALAALAHPPFGLIAGLLAYPVLMLLSERSITVRGAFWMGWLGGFAYFLISCWWVAEAFFVNPAQAWMAPFAASLLPAGLGLFWGTAAALYRRFRPLGLLRFLVFAALFCSLEWLRGHVLTGFPWNPAGASWKAGSAMSQFASVAGVYGLGLVTVAAVSSVAVLFGREARTLRVGVVLGGAGVLIGLFVFGSLRLSDSKVEPTDTVVRLVQANIEQETKWTPEAYQSIVDRYVNLTRQAPSQDTNRRPDIIIWPEGALPASANTVFAPGSADAVAISEALQPGQLLLMGLARGEPAPQPGDPDIYYNSLFALADEGGPGLRIVGVYDKHRLVPFGEYLPLGELVSAVGIRSLVHMPSDFTAGPAPAPLDLPGRSRVQPLICYESLYPGFTPGGDRRPDWIVNVSNDAWFGATSGPLQHLNLASYRAIETGLPVARATPTGVSAMVDPWGRVVAGQSLGSGQSGIIDAVLPRPAPATPYSRYGDLLFLVLLGLMFFPVLPFRKRGRLA